MQECKCNFVYERATEEDEKLVRKLRVKKRYNSGYVTYLREIAVDRDKGMFLFPNDGPGSLVLEGIEGPEVDTFIYKNCVNEIHYTDNYTNFKYDLMIEGYYVDPMLLDEKQYVVDAMREALIVAKKGRFGNCELVSDNCKVGYKY